jgi:hypothetical protein
MRFYWVFGRFIEVIRWALDRIAYAVGVILFSAAVVSGIFASAGLVAAVAIWTMSNINLLAVTHREALLALVHLFVRASRRPDPSAGLRPVSCPRVF